jgi:hypothetical protein
MFALKVPLAIMLLSNKSKNKGTNVKKLSIVTMWPLSTKPFLRGFTTFLPWRPSPFPLRNTSGSEELSPSLSSSDLLFTLCELPPFLQYISKFYRYLDKASTTARTLILKPRGGSLWVHFPYYVRPRDNLGGGISLLEGYLWYPIIT